MAERPTELLQGTLDKLILLLIDVTRPPVGVPAALATRFHPIDTLRLQ